MFYNEPILTIGRRFINTAKKKDTKNFKDEWHLINWKEAEAKTKDLQEKIVIATLKENMKEVYRCDMEAHTVNVVRFHQILPLIWPYPYKRGE